jgi:hypothetical protein
MTTKLKAEQDVRIPKSVVLNIMKYAGEVKDKGKVA